MQENIKDPYHPGLLHTWFVTFGLWRADNRSQLKMDPHFRHAAMISTRGQGGKKGSVTQVVSSFKEQMQLNDRSEEHTSELQSLMRNSYAVFCLKKKIQP